MIQVTAAAAVDVVLARVGVVKMPKFYRQNKKRIDPRYFLNETLDRDTEDLILEDDDDKCHCVDKETGEKTRDFVRDGGRGCRGSERKVCPEKTFEPEVRNIKNRYNKINKMFNDSGTFTKKRGIDR